MAKATKIDDIKRPDKVTPNPTSRPVIVTNRPTLKNDPMMASDDTKSEEGSEAIPMTHSAKTIIPINPNVSPDPDPAEPDSPPKDVESMAGEDKEENSQSPEDTDTAQSETEGDSRSEPVEEVVPTASVEQDTKVSEHSVGEGKPTSGAERDPEAAVTAEEAALAEEKARRDQEVEDIIASGKYVVPIDAVQRRRSHIATVSLFILALVLALILVDAILDVGIVHVPSSIPHTHFFSKQ